MKLHISLFGNDWQSENLCRMTKGIKKISILDITTKHLKSSEICFHCRDIYLFGTTRGAKKSQILAHWHSKQHLNSYHLNFYGNVTYCQNMKKIDENFFNELDNWGKQFY